MYIQFRRFLWAGEYSVNTTLWILKMDKPCFYEIRIEGHLTERWSAWFEGVTIHHDPCGETLLIGSFIDQAALLGALNKIHALNLTLISVNRLSQQRQT